MDKEPISVDFQKLLEAKLQIGGIRVQGHKIIKGDYIYNVLSPYLYGNTLNEVVDDLSLALEKLRQTNSFKSVDALLEKSIEPGKTDVIFTFSERPRLGFSKSLQLGDDLNDSSATAYFHLRNIFIGHAESLSPYLSWGYPPFSRDPSVRVGAQLRFPLVGSSRKRSGIDVVLGGEYVPKWRQHNAELKKEGICRGYETNEKAVWFRLGDLSAWGSLTYEARFRDLNTTDNVSETISNDAKNSFKSSLSYSVERDNRDSKTVPREGDMKRLDIEVAGLGGDVFYCKTQAQAQGHYALGEKDTTFSWVFGAGAMFPFNNAASNIQDKFYLGLNSFRGFRRRGLGPHEDHDSIGGELFYRTNASLSLPLPETFLDRFIDSRLHFFISAGDLCSIKSAQNAVANIMEKPGGLMQNARLSTGLGIVMNLPIGRLEINWNQILRNCDGDRPRNGLQVLLSTEYC